MSPLGRALEAWRGLWRGSDDTHEHEPSVADLIEGRVDPEARIRAMKGLTDAEKEQSIARLREARSRAAAEQAERFTREQFADELEAPGSLLCDCDDPAGNPPTRRGRRLDHHCDCAAVKASAMIRRGESVTRHGRECGCLVEDNAVREDLGLEPLP